MKLDSIITGILVRIGNKHQVKTEKVNRIIDAYHKGIKEIIENNNKEATCIKLDFLGKIIFDERKAKTVKRVKAEKAEAKVRALSLSLDEINSYKSRNTAT